MGISHSEAYAAAGVDIEAGYQGVKMMNRYVQRTLTADVISDLGGFGGLFSLDLHGLEKPVLVSGTDGVGTKQRIAQLMDRHNTVGIDCVAMCVNDIICCGAKPLFFLDYIAIGKNIPEKVVSLVSGVSEGCVRAGCALIGGETAEHPGTMKPDDYDLAGFCRGRRGPWQNSGQEQNAAGRCGHRAALQRAALQRLLARAQGVRCGERRPRAVLR